MRTVLLVDDSAVARRVLVRRLEAEGFQVSEASSMAMARKVDFASLGCAIIDPRAGGRRRNRPGATSAREAPGAPRRVLHDGNGAVARGGRPLARPGLPQARPEPRRGVGEADDAPESAAADEMNDLDLVARPYAVLRVERPRDHRAVDLHGDRPFVEAQVIDEGANGDVVGNVARRAVDRDLHGKS